MTIDRRAMLMSVPFTVLLSINRTKAESLVSWDGTWTGLWGGADDTSIKIVDNKVVGYSFKGTTQSVDTRNVTDKQFSFGTRLFTITLTRTSETTAVAKFQSDTMGVTKADLTKQ